MTPAPSVLDLTRQLVGIDSQNPGTGERDIAKFTCDYAAQRGMEAQVVETAEGRCNVLVTIDAGPGPRLGLSGHLDTKPIGDALPVWRTDPLELTVDGDLAYGLGSSDMKGAVAAMLLAAERWAGRASRGRLTLVLTADEEAGSEHGAKELSRRGLVDADAIVIGEPSGISEPWEALYVVSRGICCFEVVIEGTQGHSGLSEQLPTSATVAAARATVALSGFRPGSTAPAAVDSRPTVNAAVRTEGGVFYGVHPGNAVVSCDIRTVPGMERGALEREVRALLADALPDDVAWDLRYVPGSLGWMEPAELDLAHPVLGAAQRACREVLGRELPLAAYPGGTDATHFIRIAGIPSITALGPGWLSVAHGPNECVGVGQLDEAVLLYDRLAHAYLGG
ncbi:acetylornithine deacetylase [Murinocardiopsis flavida]|uniref:Acetylornithine deacetylase n=1 Tax=Murinocardiopsis flavida TaxID=645275 RepID=A0A2P8CXM3_9ACTN|nr:M20/M25/M40 family metallo-hydrolase [Murinocardiopsis flavida]PSK89687.1 acetylornithine deacetylase [Murinocardiopsis flavida]